MKTVRPVVWGVSAVLAAAAMPAQAGDTFQRVDFYGAWTQVDGQAGARDQDGWGGGLRIVGGKRVGFFGDLQGSYAAVERKAAGVRDQLDFGDYRAGLGWGFPAFGAVGFAQLKAEYVSLQFKDRAAGSRDHQDGFGVHVQLEQDIAGTFGLRASVGYVNVEDAQGPELTLGYHWVPDTFGVFTEFRWMSLDAKHGPGEFETVTVRAGFRVPFGGSRQAF
ncbi:outer membrane beta-barrel protein [Sinimarinibacterium sp. NLF-5-8]|uniref:outer membrane beta-barrel protein n=1 Tax=Sinimarinibacterium sp. NLF-5-8 TaxID=2698684 RepID=UPI00137BAF78|nr:outer membrane beta-barrel protein [Sinimarinibacterium sp. NLF-5-8]QHS10178.1 hypothetical protein GT972_08495 [Sinimarinibacterium sp. NLF-5-8]